MFEVPIQITMTNEIKPCYWFGE